MTEARARKSSPTRMSSSTKKQPAVHERYQRHPPPRDTRPTRSLHISISLLILTCFVLYAQRNAKIKPRLPYEPGGRSLPEWYGICSREGKKVYTVPKEGGIGPVECVVVGGKEVIDSGSLGRLFRDQSRTFLTLMMREVARIRRRWGDRETIGAVDESPSPVRQAGGLRIIYLAPGNALTPVGNIHAKRWDAELMPNRGW